MRPNVALRPLSPQHDDGQRIDPTPSVPIASGATPAASAALAPPLDPPGVCSRLQGLRVTPKAGLSVNTLWANSGRLVLPMMIAPAALARATTAASSAAMLSMNAAEPFVQRTPATATLSLTVIGTPCSGPSAPP